MNLEKIEKIEYKAYEKLINIELLHLYLIREQEKEQIIFYMK